MNLLISKQAAELFGTDRRIIGASLEELSRKWGDLRDASGEGCSFLGNGGNVLDDNGKRIATISYNGRVWPVDTDEHRAMLAQHRAMLSRVA